MFHLDKDEYVGLHSRYGEILQSAHHTLTLDKETEDKVQAKLAKAFKDMMSALFKQKGATLNINILASDQAQEFIGTHASILDSSFKTVKMSEGMRRRLERSNYIFSGLKTFHELNEAFPSLIDENGNRKPFERFLNDVKKVDTTYNRNYLRAEYNFVQSSAEMAAKWEQFSEDGDRYNLQYRTAGDSKVRPEHAALGGVTLPLSDPFWESYYPPNGWGCRCTVVQVRKSKYPLTPHDEAMARGEEALQGDTKGIFRFNAGKQQKTVPDYNQYTIRRCNDCDLAKGKTTLAFVPDNELCAACRIVRALAKADTKTTRKEAKPLQGTTIANPDFPHRIAITRKTITEWTNQPFKYLSHKNRMLLNIGEVIAKAKYVGVAENHKGIKRLVQSHIFETTVRDIKAYIIVREYDWGEFVLHSISDAQDYMKHVKKK